MCIRDSARAVITATHERVNHLDAQRRLEVLSVTDHQAGEQALRDGRAEALLERVDGSWQILTFRDAQESLTAELGQTVRERTLTANAVAAGTSVEALNRGTTLTSAALDPQAVADSGIARALGFAFAMLFYVAALSFGMQIAQSVVEEKQSRIVEIPVSYTHLDVYKRQEYAKTEPDWVRAWVLAHPQLSGLSRREALKHL